MSKLTNNERSALVIALRLGNYALRYALRDVH
jgi:hypothetical protein